MRSSQIGMDVVIFVQGAKSQSCGEGSRGVSERLYLTIHTKNGKDGGRSGITYINWNYKPLKGILWELITNYKIFKITKGK